MQALLSDDVREMDQQRRREALPVAPRLAALLAYFAVAASSEARFWD
jgi:hypothetical protein